MEHTLIMKYKDNNGLVVEYYLDDDATLADVFAKFVNMTRIMGYQAGSWDKIIENLIKYEIDAEDYSIFEWAYDTIY